MSEIFDPYRILDVPKDAAAPAIKAAFRERSKATHPDVGGNIEAFVAVRRAYLVLSDPAKRLRYDETGAVDDDSDLRFHGYVASLQAKLFEEVIGTGQAFRKDVDIVKAMVNCAGEAAGMVAKGLSEAREHRDRLRALAGRISRKEGDNLFRAIVERKATDVETQIAVMERETKGFAAVLAELETYECVTELAQHVSVFHGLSTTTNIFGSY